MSAFKRWTTLLALVTVATVGVDLIGLPSAPLFGGLVGSIVFALLLSGSATLPSSAFRMAQAVVGVTVGALIDWERLSKLGEDWPAVILVCVATLLLSVAAGQLLRLHDGVSASTAFFAAIAGGASGMTAMAREFGADERVATVVQYLRVLVILSTLPWVVELMRSDPSASAAGSPGPSWSPTDYVLAVAAAIAAIGLGRLLRLPSPAILGGICVGALVPLAPPFEDFSVPLGIQGVAFLMIGIQVGLGFDRSTLRSLARMLPTAIALIAVIVVLCAGLGVLLSALTGVSRLDGYLATTPGGLPAVLAASTSTGGDITFVSTVQVLRVLIVLISAPFLAHWIFRWGREPEQD